MKVLEDLELFISNLFLFVLHDILAGQKEVRVLAAEHVFQENYAFHEVLGDYHKVELLFQTLQSAENVLAIVHFRGVQTHLETLHVEYSVELRKIHGELRRQRLENIIDGSWFGPESCFLRIQDPD